MKAKNLKKNINILLLTIKFLLKMAPFVKLAIISKMGEEVCFVQK